MSENKSSISQAQSYAEIGECWDEHDLSEVWDETGEVDFAVNVETQAIYFPVDANLSEKLRAAAARHGVTAEALVNLWLQERVNQETSAH